MSDQTLLYRSPDFWFVRNKGDIFSLAKSMCKTDQCLKGKLIEEGRIEHIRLVVHLQTIWLICQNYTYWSLEYKFSFDRYRLDRWSWWASFHLRIQTPRLHGDVKAVEADSLVVCRYLSFVQYWPQFWRQRTFCNWILKQSWAAWNVWVAHLLFLLLLLSAFLSASFFILWSNFTQTWGKVNYILLSLLFDHSGFYSNWSEDLAFALRNPMPYSTALQKHGTI